jgi:hypothetical protein
MNSARIILAIDPGSESSGFVIWNGESIIMAGVETNPVMLTLIDKMATGLGSVCADLLAIENVGHYGTGMPAGKTVFDTCIWIGRFIQKWSERRDDRVQLVLRTTVKTHLCGSVRAKDSNVYQAIRDRREFIGGKGTKKQPGPLHGVTSHAIQALALAIYIYDHEILFADIPEELRP